MRMVCWVLLLGVLVLLPSGCGHPTTMVALQVSPSEAGVVGVAGGLQIQFTATGVFVHPSETVDVTDQVAWASNTTAVVTVSQQGLATSGTTCGGALITATASEPLIGRVGTGAVVTGTATFTVADPAIEGCPSSVPD